MKKKLMALALASAVGLLVWGCGSKGSTADTQPVTTTEEVTEADTQTADEAGTEVESAGETQPNGGTPDEYSFNGEVLSVTEGELRVRLLEDCGADLKQDDEVVVFFNNGDFKEGDTVYIEFNGTLMSEENVRLAATVLYVTE